VQIYADQLIAQHRVNISDITLDLRPYSASHAARHCFRYRSGYGTAAPLRHPTALRRVPHPLLPRPPSPLFHLDQRRTFGDQCANGVGQAQDDAVVGGSDDMFHFHRLQHHQRLVRRHAIPFAH
jgi:hypothetical protein